MLLATPVLSDTATLSGSASSGSLTIDNLKTVSLKEVYRAADASNVVIVADLLEPKIVNLVALIGHSGSSRSYARVTAANTMNDLDTAPNFDTGYVPFRSHQSGYDASWAASVVNENSGALEKNMFLQHFGEQVYQFWKIEISDPNSSYLDIGRLYIANAWQPETNMDYGLAEGIVDPSRKNRTVGGDTASVERKTWRWVEFTLSYLTKDEMFLSVFQIEKTRGRTKDVLYIVDPDETDYLQFRSIYGTMETIQPKIHTNFGLFSKSFRIEELLP